MAKTAAVAVDVRYRPTDSAGAWGAPQRFGFAQAITVRGLDRGKSYDFQVRSVSSCGAASAWVPAAHVVSSALLLPGDIETLGAQSLADGVHLDWTVAVYQPSNVEFSLERTTDPVNGPWTERTRTRTLGYTDPETTGTPYYYRVRAVTYSGIFGSYSEVVDSNGVSVSAIGETADEALAQAQSAQASADAANTALAAIASDNVLSPTEKPVVIRDYSVLTSEQAGIDAQATAFTITTEKTAYDNAISALTTYLGTLTAPKAWNDVTGNTTIVGATFRAKFATAYTTRQTLLNAIYAAAKALANTAQGTANTANANTPTVLNPQFQDGANGWTFGAGWTVNSFPAASRTGTGTPAQSAIVNTELVPIKPNQQAKITGVLTASGADGSCAIAAYWYDANGNFLSTSVSIGFNTVTGTALRTGCQLLAVAPANAAFVAAAAVAISHAHGTYTASFFMLSTPLSNLDELPDSGGRKAVTQVDGNGLAIVDFSQSGHVNKNLDNIADGPVTFGRTLKTYLNANRPITDFSATYHLNKNIGNVPDGGGRFAVHQVDGNGLAIVDFSQAAHVNKTLDYMGDGATYARPLSSRVNAGRPLIDFGETIHANKHLGNIADDAVSGRYGAIQAASDQANTATWAAASYSPGQNMVPDPRFMLGALVWGTLGSNWSIRTSTDGSNYLCYVYQATAETSSSSSPLLACPPSVDLCAAADVFAVALAAGDMTARLQFFTTSKVFISSSTRVFTIAAGTSDYTRFSAHIGQSPANAAYVTFQFFSESAHGSGECHIKNVKLEQATTPTPFTDDSSQFGNQLAVPGSGRMLGDQYNAPGSLVRGYGAVRSATALTALSSGAVNVNAHTVTMGTRATSYSAKTNAVTGLSVGGTYFIYTHDSGAGGSPTYLSTTSAATANSFDDAYIAGNVTIPSSGSSGGGGAGGGSGAGCVGVDMFLRPRLRAKNVRWWHWLHVGRNGRRYRWFQTGRARVHVEPAVWIDAEGGAQLLCSIHTPFDLRDGSMRFARDMYGQQVLTDRGWRRVRDVRDAGMQPVMRIHVGGRHYAAGTDPTNRIYSHNPVK